jgi:hypothetical protein
MAIVSAPTGNIHDIVDADTKMRTRLIRWKRRKRNFVKDLVAFEKGIVRTSFGNNRSRISFMRHLEAVESHV